MPMLLRAGVFAALLILFTTTAPRAAPAAVPATLALEFERIAQSYSDDARADSAADAAQAGDDLATMTRRAARHGAMREMAAAVIGAIAEMPLRTDEIVAAAIRAAPSLEAGIVRDTLAAFPGFQATILAAAARARTPLPVEAAADTAEAKAIEGVSTPPPLEEIDAGGDEPEEISDPFEDFNRVVFFLNDGLDRVLIRPLAWLYGNLVPAFAKRRVSNAFSNINEPVVLANDLLQLELEDAGASGARFLINSTVGLAGLFDVASEIGLEPHKADFGQTLHSHGAGPGPYLVLPLLGPSNLRDGAGLVVDTLLNPLTWLLKAEENLIIAGAKGLVRREELLRPLDALRASSVDYYAALRSLYYQNRAVTLRRGAAADGSSLDAEFDAFK